MLHRCGEHVSYYLHNDASAASPQISRVDIEDDILSAAAAKDYKNTILSTSRDYRTIVPEGLYEYEMQQELLDFNYGDTDDNKGVVSNYLKRLGGYVVHGVDEITDNLLNQFKVQEAVHAASVLVEASLRSAIKDNSTEVTVYYTPSFIELIVCQGKKLLLCNHFQIKSAADFTYYIVYALDLLNIPYKKQAIRIGGVLPDEYLDVLQSYCPLAGYHRFSYYTETGKDLSDQEYAENLVLLNQFKCA